MNTLYMNFHFNLFSPLFFFFLNAHTCFETLSTPLIPSRATKISFTSIIVTQYK